MMNYGKYHQCLEIALWAEWRKVQNPKKTRRAVVRRIARLDEYRMRAVSNSR